MFERCHREFVRKLIFSVLMVLNFGILFVFKYLKFTMENLDRIMSIQLNLPDILLPIGISFYTFQITRYVIDVYRGVM